MKYIKTFENSGTPYPTNIQEIVFKLKGKKPSLNGNEHLLTNIVIDLLDSIWGTKTNMKDYSDSNLNSAMKNIETYLSR